MNNKIVKTIKNEIITYKWFYISMIVITLLFVIKLDYNIESPGELIDLTDRINVENSYEQKGTFNLTYVTSRPGTLSNILLSYIIPNWDLYDLNNMRYETESEDEIIERNKILLKQTSYDAIIAAFDEANIPYEVINNNVVVAYIYNKSNTDLKVGDIIKNVNGVRIDSFTDLKTELEKYKENDIIKISVLRDNKVVECTSKLINENGNVYIGIQISELKNIKTNPKVSYVFENNESGSSRGLMCALDIYNKITSDDLTKGYKVAGTGTINSAGIVGEIGGVKYKLIGAVKEGASIFIVPSNNYEEALQVKKDNNYDIELIEADNLHNVIEKLKKY